MNKVHGLGLWVAAVILSFSVSVLAQTPAPTDGPREVVERMTTDILQVLKDKRHLLEDDPETFYQAVSGVLSPVVAFDYIAGGVMGRYKAQATTEQRQRFSEVFQMDLISTYAKGMAVYGDDEIVIEPLKGDPNERGKVSVIQKVRGAKGENTVSYTMGKSKINGQWLMLNVTINGVNLGKNFLSQFARAMKKEGDLDAVIDGWSAKGS